MARQGRSAAMLRLVLLPVIWNRVLAIDCFECYSFNKSDAHCGDPFHPIFGTLAKDCTQAMDGRIGEFPAKYCIKLIGNTAKDDIEMVFRGCSIESLDSQCSDFTFEDVRYNGCVMSCMDDGCNSASSGHISAVLMLLTLCAALHKSAALVYTLVC